MDESYAGREQSAAKHHVLEQYLEELAYKVSFFRPGRTLNYIDGFAGPWESHSEDLSDTSPALALRKLLEVRDRLGRSGIEIGVRAFFVSPDPSGAAQLRALRSRFPAAEIHVAEKTFEESLGDARQFAAAGSDPFTFIFIDPTGWTGFGLHAITPLLRAGKNEVLINFMTGHITRFVDSEDTRYEATFLDLFGDTSHRETWKGLESLDREEKIVEAYCKRIAAAGNYRHCVSAAILNPRFDRTYFHLIYGTRSDVGLSTFRNVEHRALAFQRTERVGAQQRDQVERTGQTLLFGGTDLVVRTYEDKLRERYLKRANDELDSSLRGPESVFWDDLVIAALQIPMITERDVRNWLNNELRQRRVEIIGLRRGERTPKRNARHRVRRLR